MSSPMVVDGYCAPHASRLRNDLSYPMRLACFLTSHPMADTHPQFVSRCSSADRFLWTGFAEKGMGHPEFWVALLAGNQCHSATPRWQPSYQAS